VNNIVNYEKLYEEMEAFFGDQLPHPEREPKRAAVYIKIFKHVRSINSSGQNPNQ
jgi:hypothetical protein